MQAMILNSGLARRLKPLTDSTHKSLLLVAGKSILERQVEALVANKITDIIITTGPFEDQIQALMSSKFPDLDVTYVRNAQYDTTNYIYSMWLARDVIASDILLLHGDLIFHSSVMEKILHAPMNSVIVDSATPLPEKDFKGRLDDGHIREVGLDIFGDDAIFLLPMYTWNQASFQRWMEEIGRFVAREETSCYAENAFNAISSELPLLPCDIAGDFCMEIDTREDLERARERLKN